MKKNLLILALFVSNYCLAQQLSAPIKWGKISKEELSLSEAPGDAAAVVLADYGVVKLDALVKGPNYYLRRHRRVKVFRPEEYSLDEIGVDFFAKNDEENLSNFRVQIIDPSEKRITLDKKVLATKQLADGRTRQFFPLPELAPGTIVEYQYDLESRQVQQLRTWYFQEEIPVQYSEYRVERPKDMDYAMRWFGVDSLVEATYTEPTPRLIEEGRNWGIDGDFKVYLDAQRYVVKNAPAFQVDHCMSTPLDYQTGVSMYLRQIFYPDGSKQVYIDSWENMTENLWEHVRLGRQITEADQTSLLLEKARSLVKSREAIPLKIKRIHQWLLDNVKWNGQYSIYSDKSLNAAVEKGEASSGERNLMLLKLMRAANLEVYPLLVSTRDHGKVAQQFPLAAQFNHLMVYWQKSIDDYQILDVTDEYLPVNFPRPEALNGDGWLMHQTKPLWVDLQPAVASDIYLVTAELMTDGACEVMIKATYTGYDAFDRRTSDSDERWKSLLEQQQSSFSLENIRTKNDKKIEQPFKEYVSFMRPAVKPVDGRVTIKPVMFSRFMMPFQEKHRAYPIDMMYPLQEQYIFILQLPDGYEVEQLPETGAGSLADNGGLFLFDILQKNGMVQVASKIQINQLKYTPEEYQNVRAFFELILDKFKEEIVLKKIENN